MSWIKCADCGINPAMISAELCRDCLATVEESEKAESKELERLRKENAAMKEALKIISRAANSSMDSLIKIFVDGGDGS